MLRMLFLSAVTLLVSACSNGQSDQSVQMPVAERNKNDSNKVVRSEKEWKSLLTPEQFHILREKGTERPYTGEYLHHDEDGIYCCAACKAPLFPSGTKFDVCGWPSFYKPIRENAIAYHTDRSHGMTRTEVTCSRCGGHLGHVFDDGPEPTGLRYCINSISLEFRKADRGQ